MSRILHAGFHKTGSSFLQREFFPRMRNIQFFDTIDSETIPIPKENSINVVFSSEAACGYPYPKTERFCPKTLENTIKKLKIKKVILVEREFYSWILSLYFQTLNEKYAWSLDEFISTNCESLLTWKNAASEIKGMCRENGVDIIVIPYSVLACTPKEALSQIAQFIPGSVDINSIRTDKKRNASRYGHRTISTFIFLNRICNTSIGRLASKFLKPRKLIAGWPGMVLDKLSHRSLSPEDARRLMR